MDRQATTSHGNNFGLLRILFAAFVVVSHSQELLDGNRSREILTRFFGTLSLGEVGVDGFFVVSGYLITKSFVERPEVGSFLVKRVARIVPGYLLSFWLCALVLAPFVGADASVVSLHQLGNNLLHNTFLLGPSVPGAFHGLRYADLNRSMWTISYEFRCYLVVAIAGALALHFRSPIAKLRWYVLAFTLAGLIVNGTGLLRGMGGFASGVIGRVDCDFELFPVFGVGALFYLFRERIKITKYGALGAACLSLILFCNRHTAEAGIAIFGGYLIFWFALKFRLLKLSSIADKNDISYGLYLYAWPIQSLIVWNYRTIDPWMLILFALIGAGFAGYASWHLIEKHALALARRRKPSPVPIQATA